MSEENNNIPTPEAATSADERTEIVGINFREAGKIYYFSPESFKLSLGDKVIVETARGVELGTVKVGNKTEGIYK